MGSVQDVSHSRAVRTRGVFDHEVRDVQVGPQFAFHSNARNFIAAVGHTAACVESLGNFLQRINRLRNDGRGLKNR